MNVYVYTHMHTHALCIHGTGTSKEYLEIKKMMWNEPKLLHSMLEKLVQILESVQSIYSQKCIITFSVHLFWRPLGT
jgi:hypothetical protein